MTSVLKSRFSRKGFTLVELLVVVLILAILMAVAIPLYLSAVQDAQTKTCRSNMQTIANAVQSARVKNNATDYSALVTAGLSTTNEPDLLTMPKCPNAGTYSIATGSTNAATFQIACTVTAHGHYEAGVDTK